MGVLTVKNKMGIKKIILKSGIIMNPIKCTNNIINNLHRALKVILKKLCQNPQICVYTSKFSPVLSGYRQKSKVEKY